MPAQRGAHGLRGSGTVPLPPRGAACKAGKLGVGEKQSYQVRFAGSKEGSRQQLLHTPRTRVSSAHTMSSGLRSRHGTAAP